MGGGGHPSPADRSQNYSFVRGPGCTVSTCADGAPSPFSTPARWRADWDAEYNCEVITQGRASASASYGDIAADSRYAHHVAQERNSKTVIKKDSPSARGISILNVKEL